MCLGWLIRLFLVSDPCGRVDRSQRRRRWSTEEEEEEEKSTEEEAERDSVVRPFPIRAQ